MHCGQWDIVLMRMDNALIAGSRVIALWHLEYSEYMAPMYLDLALNNQWT